MKLSEILKNIDHHTRLSKDIEINDFIPFNPYNKRDDVLMWTREPKKIEHGILICTNIKLMSSTCGYILSDNPRFSAAQASYCFPKIPNEIHESLVIGHSSTIGSDGFGYENGLRFNHIGNVIIEEGVEIGSNTCIDRGTLGSTIIGKGVKIDNLVHIAHNVVIGEGSLIIACAMIAGSVTIGDNVWIGPSVSIAKGLYIGDNAVIGMGAVVLKDVPEGATMVGNPAKRIR